MIKWLLLGVVMMAYPVTMWLLVKTIQVEAKEKWDKWQQ